MMDSPHPPETEGPPALGEASDVATLLPSLVSWNITRQCNLSCSHCYRDARAVADPDELSTAEGLALIAEVARAGFRVIILSGGEPLLRPDLLALVGAAREQGLRPVLGSNGTLITRRDALRLREVGLARVGISLDSADCTYHNELRRRARAWDRAIAGMRACQEVGLPFQVNTTVTRQNEEQLLQITDLAEELGAAAHHAFFLVPTGRGSGIADDMVEARRVESLLEALLKRQQQTPIEIKPTCAPQFIRVAHRLGIRTRFSLGCLAGRTYCVITPNGTVHPCPYLPLEVGNVRAEAFSELWARAPAFQRLRQERLEGVCGRCRWSQRCFGCRARAFWASGGSLMAEDPWCARKRSA